MFEKVILGSEIKILLYILIGMAYLFNRLYRKEQSKSREFKQNGKPVSRQTSEDIFRELRKSLNLPEDKPDEPVVPQMKNAGSTFNKPKLVVKGMNREKMRSEFKPKRWVHKNKIIEVQDEKLPDTGVSLDFDLRQAILFSEILKRPEY